MAGLQIITVLDFAEITSGCNVQSYQITCYRNLTWQTKAWHESTNCIEQKYLTDHEPKGHRKYDGTHVNMAKYMTDSYMVETKISRHFGELVPLTTEQYMAWQGNKQQEDMFMKLRMARTNSQGAWITNNKHGNIELNVNRLTGNIIQQF